MSTESAYETGRILFDSFVRGDALIGIMPDPDGALSDMAEALWSAALGGHARAYRVLGDSYLAALRPSGAFDGLPVEDAEDRAFSEQALSIEVASNPPLGFALRCYYEAGRLGDREALLHYARLSRNSTEAAQRLALATLQDHPTISPAERYQIGLIHHWLGEIDAASEAHHLAAAQGNADAQFELYVYYTQGLAGEKDDAKAHSYLLDAAAQEHHRALYNLGAGAAMGTHGPADPIAAAGFYVRAATAGNPRAAGILAAMILTGELEGDTAAAIRWLEHGDALGGDGQQLLWSMGLDDPRDPPEDD